MARREVMINLLSIEMGDFPLVKYLLPYFWQVLQPRSRPSRSKAKTQETLCMLEGLLVVKLHQGQAGWPGQT